MELVFEFIAELILEGSIEISSNKKISKWIRYPILFILILLFSVVIFGILILGLFLLEKNILFALFFIAVSLILFISAIKKFKETYIQKKDK